MNHINADITNLAYLGICDPLSSSERSHTDIGRNFCSFFLCWMTLITQLPTSAPWRTGHRWVFPKLCSSEGPQRKEGDADQTDLWATKLCLATTTPLSVSHIWDSDKYLGQKVSVPKEKLNKQTSYISCKIPLALLVNDNCHHQTYSGKGWKFFLGD